MSEDDGRTPPNTTLTREEMEKSANRLSTRHRPEVQLQPLVPRRTLTAEAEERSIKHLYDDSMAHREQRLREIEANMNAEIDRYRAQQRKLDEEEKQQLVHRLYEESIEKKDYKMKELYERELASLQRNTRTLGKSEQASVVDRLYTEGMANNRKKHIALFEKFVLDRQPQSVQRTPEQLMETCDKLWKGEGVTS
ncbi:uncharacterized protein TM35_000063500 [Trypanosoma theileri]|uniref:Uncharacterized protein n=1 Tax=Trypanosoma theileri TaxID=67003 RepID=A0A1X0P384_9TRYP|nr:uncharacterized protein TM35_000063500 [Trypanosoma theileri]ORC91345.1 hypothetical protein TM35_000063500 [Trypanosoma theileri]